MQLSQGVCIVATRRGIPLKQKGKVYRTCVQSVMVYASETWAVRVREEQRMGEK